MTNIFKQLRIDTGLSINTLAGLTGLSRFYIIKLEDLLYETLEPSSAVARVMAAHVDRSMLVPLYPYGIPQDPSPQGVSQVYSAAVRLNRLALSTKVPPISADRWVEISAYLAAVGTDTNKNHPHVILRKEIFREYNRESPITPPIWDNYSQVYYCKLTNVHPAILSKYESGGSEKMPASILDALVRLQVPPVLIDWCDERNRSRINYLGGPSKFGRAPMEHILLEESVGIGDD